MRSIKANFEKQKKKNPFVSDLVNFSSVIRGTNFTPKVILENFHKLVDKNDYDHLKGKEKKELNSFLISLLKHPEER